MLLIYPICGKQFPGYSSPHHIAARRYQAGFAVCASGKRYGIEVKFSEAPEVTRSMQIARQDLELEHLWVVYPGEQIYPVHERITVLPLANLSAIETGLGGIIPGRQK